MPYQGIRVVPIFDLAELVEQSTVERVAVIPSMTVCVLRDPSGDYAIIVSSSDERQIVIEPKLFLDAIARDGEVDRGSISPA